MRNDLKLYVKIYIPNGNGKVAKEGWADKDRSVFSSDSGIVRIVFIDDGKTYATSISNILAVIDKEGDAK